MRLGICTIQRNRAKWLAEWVAFHHLVGCTHFYIYLHKCTDNSKQVVVQLQQHFNIQCFELGDDVDRPQLAAYQHCYQSFGHEIDWMAFIDGDEFLFPTQADNLQTALQPYTYEKMSALGVYWQCFGSSGHIQEPEGLVTENYVHRAPLSFEPNRHIKSIVKGSQGEYCTSAGNAHVFNTIHGTYDELLRPVSQGFMRDLEPSYAHFCINHYATQSYDFYLHFKQNSGAADASASVVRTHQWWETYDRNEEVSHAIDRFIPELKRKLEQIQG